MAFKIIELLILWLLRALSLINFMRVARKTSRLTHLNIKLTCFRVLRDTFQCQESKGLVD